MSKFLKFFLVVLLFSGISSSPVFATALVLEDWAFNIDGNISEFANGDTMPVSGTLTDGLGQLSWSTSQAGEHTFIAFFDFEIDETVNGFFNEYGKTSGTAASGQLWEIDEPGYVFGDIYDHVLDMTLDNLNGVGQGFEDDVSFALGWTFTLADDERAEIRLNLSDVLPQSGFFLSHVDPESDASVHFSSTLSIQGGGVPIPEPASLVLVGLGLFTGALVVKRKKR